MKKETKIMKIQMVILAGLLVASVAQAGVITFGAKTPMVNDAAGSSVLVNGTAIIAGNARGGPSTIVNGVDFKQLSLNGTPPVGVGGVSLDLTGALVGNGAVDAATTFFSANAALGSMIRSSYESSGYGIGNLDIGLAGLTPGQEYQLQSFYWDNGKTFNAKDLDNPINSAVYFSSAATAYSWTATWTQDAGSTTKNIGLTIGTRVTLAATSLRAIPEPATFGLMGLASAGIFAARRFRMI
jgi:hypothetical protein